MMDEKRIKPLCDKLAYVWKEYFPDWRFCQFFMNFLSWFGRDPFYLEDDKFGELLDKYVEEKFGGKE